MKKFPKLFLLSAVVAAPALACLMACKPAEVWLWQAFPNFMESGCRLFGG
jgi:hypothetical protein